MLFNESRVLVSQDEKFWRLVAPSNVPTVPTTLRTCTNVAKSVVLRPE